MTERPAILETPARPPRPAARHVAPVDGLRAAAILSVTAYHATVPGASLGWLGVDLFFVLSGFLITTLLLREHAASGRIDLPRFLLRRFLRLMPLYWLFAASLTVVILVAPWGWVRTYGRWTPGLYVASIWGYFVNFAPVHAAVWEHQMDFSSPLWSLALEEQYYLVWPATLAALVGTRWLPRVAWSLVALTLARRGFAGPAALFAYPGARGVGLLIGSAAAVGLGVDPGPRARRWLSLPAARAGVIVSGLLAVLAVDAAGPDFAARWLVPAACPFFALTTAMLWHGPRDALARALSWPPLTYVGRVSYGMYVFNMPAHYLTWGVLLAGIEGWPGVPKYAVRAATFLALDVGMASASYFLLERRFLAIKERFR